MVGFASGSLTVSAEEPSIGTTSVRLTVLRNRGTTGPVQVEWNVTLNNGKSASDDVSPVKGNVRFLTGENRQEITISILPDNISEDDEVCSIFLSVNNIISF